jgi:5-methylcytosine-specific restriction endonuclease McrA
MKKTCHICGSSISGSRATKYCSTECRAEAARIRTKKWTKENSEWVTERNARHYAENKDVEVARRRLYRMEHRQEERERWARWRESHRDDARENQARYYATHSDNWRAQAHKRRVLIASGPQHTLGDELRAYLLSSGRCTYCGAVTSWERGHIDHVVPLARGGGNDRGNIVWSCAFCNRSKGAKLLVEWTQEKRRMERAS